MTLQRGSRGPRARRSSPSPGLASTGRRSRGLIAGLTSRIAHPRARRGRAVDVAALVVVLEIAVFWSYFVGFTAPHGDFMASYLSDGYLWWTRGGIVSPPEWFSYVWMGRPAAANLQSSAYFLPVGLASLFHYPSPHLYAVVAALMAGFGAVGMYVLTHRLIGNHFAALAALVGQFFSPLVFANAQHQDIARGAVLLPWLLLVMSPRWSWHRRWGLPVAALIVWQFLIGAYPGQIVAAVYCLSVWWLAWIVLARERGGWIWRSVLASVLGVALSLVKFIPSLTVGSGDRVIGPQSTGLSPSILATFLFPYDDPGMINDISMRPLFVVAPVLLAVALLPRPSRALSPVVTLAGAAGLLIAAGALMPSVVVKLPGMSLSRFWLNDIKGFLLAALVMLGAASLASLQSDRPTGAVRGAALRLAVVGIAVLGLASTLTWSLGLATAWRVGVVLCILGAAAVAILALVRGGQGSQKAPALILVVAMVSGLFFAYSVRSTWASYLPGLERFHFGTSVASLVENSDCEPNLVQRPARHVPPGSADEYWHDSLSLAGAFTCGESIAGYVNIGSSPVLREQDQAFRDDASGRVREFFAAPGGVFPLPATSADLLDIPPDCLAGLDCPGLSTTPVTYDPEGHFEYQIESARPQVVVLNESFYPGWTATWCAVGGSCEQLEVTRGPVSSIKVTLPRGTGHLDLTYATPWLGTLQTVMWLALVAAAALGLLRPTPFRVLSEGAV